MGTVVCCVGLAAGAQMSSIIILIEDRELQMGELLWWDRSPEDRNWHVKCEM